MRIPIPIILALLTSLLLSCSPEEPLIDSFDESWRYLVATRSGLGSVSMPSGVMGNIAVWTTADGSISYPVASIHEYRDQIYLLVKDGTIVVMDRSTLLATDTLALDGKGPATDIAFANATTAYVCLPQDSSVGILDLTVGQLVATIPVEGTPAGIAALGNQICAALYGTQDAVIIDSRTNSVEARIALPTNYPRYVAASPTSGTFCVVCLGAGKVAGDDRPKTTPTMSVIDASTRTLTTSVELTNRVAEGPDQLPYGLAINSQGFAFIPVQQGLLFTNTRSATKASPVVFDEYHSVYYHAARAQVVVIRPDGRTIHVYNEFAESRSNSVTLPDSVSALIGIAP